MSLFIDNEFTGHAGTKLKFKIECDALTDEYTQTIASVIAQNYTFRSVRGVRRGELRLAQALEKYVSPTGILLIVDDVLTSGMLMEEERRGFEEETLGIVIFARGPCPSWAHPLFHLSEWAGP